MGSCLASQREQPEKKRLKRAFGVKDKRLAVSKPKAKEAAKSKPKARRK